MTDRILYAVATNAAEAQKRLLHIGGNDLVFSDKTVAQLQANRMTEMSSGTYKVFAGQVTVALLED